MFKKWMFALLGAWSGGVYAQSEIDLFRFSSLRNHPTARIAGLGGAFGALGADLGSSVINPAGLANVRKTTLWLSPGFMNTQADGSYLGNLESDGRNRLVMGNVGFVFAQKPADGTKWHQINYGFSMHRTGFYNGQQRYEGLNSSSSMIDFFLDEANFDDFEFFPEDFPFSAALAETAGLIFPTIPGNRQSPYLGIVPKGSLLRQREIIRTNGRTNDYNFSVAANYDHKLFLGGGISLMSSSLIQVEEYSEFDHLDTIFDFRDFTYRRNLDVEAEGFMIRLGAIFQPVKWVRFGLSYESPTRYTVTDDYRAQIEANFDSVPTFGSARSPLFRPFVYRYNTSGRMTLSGAVLFGGQGLISIDYDIVPYDNIKVRPQRGDQTTQGWANSLNDRVATVFTASNNLRLGGEYIVGPLALRAGYSHWGSPFRRGIDTGGGDWVQNDYTAGVGYRYDNISLDFSIVHARWKTFRLPYSVPGLPEDGVLFQNRRTMGMLSLGFRID
jgi:hypothetical protein